MNTDEISKFYDMLGHKKQTEIRAINKALNPVIKTFFIDNKNDFINQCIKFNDEGYSVFAGVNERTINCTEDKDVISLKYMLIDMDHANDRDQKVVESMFKELELNYKYKISTGNGYHYYFPIPEINDNYKIQEFLDFNKLVFSKLYPRKIKNPNKGFIDSTIYNPSRIMRVWGTDNKKDLQKIKFVTILENNNLNELQIQNNYYNFMDYYESIKKKMDKKKNNVITENINTNFELPLYNHLINNPDLIKDKSTGCTNNNLLKNLAIYAFLKYGDTDEIKKVLIDFSKNIKRNSQEILGWFNKAVKKELTDVNLGELIIWNNILKQKYMLDLKDYIKKVDKILTPKEQLINDVYLRMLGKQIDKLQAYDLISNYLIEQYNFKTISDERWDTIYYYKDGIYVQGGKSIIMSESEEILGDLCSSICTNEIINKIKRKTQINREELDNAPDNMICVQNGIIVIDKEIKFIEHNPKYHFMAKLKTKYNKDSKCPITLNFLKDALYKEDLECFQRFIGYFLLRKGNLKKAFILEGPTNSGKTLTLNKITELLGMDNTAGESLQNLCADRFAMVGLYGKLANIFDELTLDGIRDINPFKAATGGGPVSGEIKGQMKFKFINYAKILYACNQIPKVEKTDDAYYDRWIIFKYDNSKEDEEQDKELLNKILTEEEMSGFLNYALEGLLKLLENYDFKYRWSREEVRDYLKRKNSNVIMFVQDKIEEEQNTKKHITKSALYNEYKSYCIKNQEEIKPENNFSSEIKRYCPYIIDSTFSSKETKKQRVWKGIKIKNESIMDSSDDILNDFGGN